MRARTLLLLAGLPLAFAACSSGSEDEGTDDSSTQDDGGGSGGRRGGTGGRSSGTGSRNNGDGGDRDGPDDGAGDVAARLGRGHFLIGMGNDLGESGPSGAFTLSKPLDLHYVYLVGLRGQGGWPDWNYDENGDGAFATYLALEAIEYDTVPMFTLYSMASAGEGSVSALTTDSYMKAYWEGARLLFERLGALDTPAVVHLEPDFWGFMQQSGTPSELRAIVSKYADECSGLPDDLSGMGKCLIELCRTYAPKTLIGFHASTWGAPRAAAVADYLFELGAGEADLVFTDMLDRDAGCFEAQAPECQRQDGPWYLDETNKTSPNFHELQDFAKTITDRLGVPMMWWQVPFGVPSDTPGGTPGHYRDNKVKYVFEHIEEFVDAGGVGVAFGVGAGNQTYITTDGGQFDAAISAYYDDPYLF